MKLRTMLIITAVLSLVYGVSYQVSAAGVLTLYGLAADPAAVFTARLFGAALIGMAVWAWLLRDTQDASTQQALVASMLAYSVVALASTLHGTVTGVMNAVGWTGVAIFLFLALGFSYCQVVLIRARRPAAPAPA